MSEIEAIITQAVHKFDLPALIDQAQQNQIKDLKAIEALSEQLGLTPEATLNILKLLKNPEPAPVPLIQSPPTPPDKNSLCL